MARKLNVESIKEKEAEGFANRASGKSENGVVTVATTQVIGTADEVRNDVVTAKVVSEKKTVDTKVESEPVPATNKGKGRPKKEEKDKRGKKVMIYLNEELYASLSDKAKDNDRSINQTVIDALREYIK